MTKITHMNRASAHNVHVALRQALKDLSDELGISITTSGAFRYTDAGFKVALEGKILDATTGDPVKSANLTYMMDHYKLSDGYRMMHDRHEYKIVEYNSRARKRPWVIERKLDKKKFVTGQNEVLKYFKVAAVPVTPSPAVNPNNSVQTMLDETARQATIARLAKEAAEKNQAKNQERYNNQAIF